MGPKSISTTLLFAALTAAQSTCTGSTSTYSQNGLTIPFKNLCGKDITAKVDFLDPTNENTWPSCLERCVKKAPLCYGFDFTPLGTAEYNCWLMNSTFLESSAVAQAYTVDAAMLTAEVLGGLASECRSLGLMGCFQKNGRLEASGSSTTQRVSSTLGSSRSSSSVTGSISISTVGPAETSSLGAPGSRGSGLSTGAKAGIGVGAGILFLLLLICGVFIFLKRRKAHQGNVGTANTSHTSDEKMIDEDAKIRGRVELPSTDARYSKAELQSPNMAPFGGPAELYGSQGARSTQIHEVDGAGRA